MSAIPEYRAVTRWQQELASAYVRLPDLLQTLGLRAEDVGLAEEAAARFPLRVPRGFVARMKPGDARDPLLRQILPTAAELVPAEGYGSDPVGDLASVRGPGLLQKYSGRALLITTGACAVHCRYCFRREFPYGELGITPAVQAEALARVAADPDLNEVILSGGDPLVLGDARFGRLLADIGAIPQIRRIRIHTRVPIVLPERVDASLVRVLAKCPVPLVVVLHANHPREIDASVAAAARQLRSVATTVLNQAVLLRDVNDDVNVLAELSETLFAAGVLPYYLHQLDRVAGAAHFAVSDARARELYAALQARLPGFLVPRLVREVAGAPAKTPL